MAWVTCGKKDDDYLWAFRCFASFFRFPPIMFCSDSEQAILNALGKMCAADGPWETLKLQVLCIFHIWKGFYEHIHPLFVNAAEAWKVLANRFWRLVKQSDRRAISTWEAECKSFVGLFETTKHLKEGKQVKEGTDWIKTLEQRGKRFAYRFTWQFFSAGTNASQRAESKNADLRGAGVRGNVGLKNVAEKVIRLGAKNEMDGRTKEGSITAKLTSDHMLTYQDLPTYLLV